MSCHKILLNGLQTPGKTNTVHKEGRNINTGVQEKGRDYSIFQPQKGSKNLGPEYLNPFVSVNQKYNDPFTRLSKGKIGSQKPLF